MEQNGGGLLECPLCADSVIMRMPSAPRLNLSGAREPEQALPRSQPRRSPHARHRGAGGRPAGDVAEGRAPRLANTEDVGERFAEEARRIHYGETPQRGIRGQVNPQQRDALRDEGIEIIALPIPRALDGPVQ